MSIPSELGHLAMPINFLAWGKNQMAQASFEPGTFRFRVLRSARCATLAGQETRDRFKQGNHCQPLLES